MPALVFGHKNPDTDSVCSAIALANLKTMLGYKAKPYVLGEVRKEAQYILNYFNLEYPEILKNVKIQVRDLSYDRITTMKPSESILEAYKTMDKNNIKTLPVSDENGTFIGLITMKDIATGLLINDHRTINTSISNICRDLNGSVLVNCNPTVEGRVITLSFDYETIKEILHPGDIVLVGDRYDTIKYAIETKVQLIIVTGDQEIPENILKLAKDNGVSIISVPLDTYETSKLINHCNYLSSIVNTKDLIVFNEDDYVDDIKEDMINTNFRSYPVVDDTNKFLGLISRKHLLNPSRKKVILVDHNEYAQSADGLDQAEILEIVDHHKIGGIATSTPINFRNVTVGCSATIIYQMYKENYLEVPYEIAGLLMSAILSDTLLFKSPTTTDIDKKAVEELSAIVGIDYEKYAMDMFKAGTSLEGYSIEQIVNMDFKEFNMEGKRVAIGQVFTLDVDSIFSKKDEFLNYINNTNYDMLVLAITDIIKEGSYILYKGSDSVISNAFDIDAYQGVFVEGLVSRKKQLVPKLTNGLKLNK